MTNSSSVVPPDQGKDSKPVKGTHHPRPTDPKTEPESSLPVVPAPEDEEDDPSISNGPLLVDTGAHAKPAGMRIAHHVDVQDAKYFERVLKAQAVTPLVKKTGKVVYGSPVQVVESLALENSRKVVVFDDAKEIGVGLDTVSWSEANDGDKPLAEVLEFQTRAGAGTALLGLLDNSADTGVVTVFATTTTLPLLLPALVNVKEGTKIILNVATTKINDDLQFTDDFSSVVQYLAAIPHGFAVKFSSTPEEIVNTAVDALAGQGSVVHFFESTYAGRQVKDFVYPSLKDSRNIDAVVTYGNINKATEVYVLPASHGANVLVAHLGGKAAVVLNAWEPTKELARVVEGKTVNIVYEHDADARAVKELVMASIFESAGTSTRVPKVPSFKTTPAKDVLRAGKDDKNTKTIAFYSSAEAPVPELLAHLFLASPALETRLSQFGSSTAQGVKSVLSLTQKNGQDAEYAPVDVHAQADVVWVTEPQLVKSVDVVGGLKQGALLVLVVPWDEEEVASKLSAAERKIIKDRNVRVFLLPPNSNPIVEQVAFLMLYTSTRKLAPKVSRVLDAFYGGYVPRELAEEAQAGLTEVEGVQDWDTEAEEEEKEKPVWEWDALPGKHGVVDVDADCAPERGDWGLAARKFLFKEAFEYKTEHDLVAAGAADDVNASVLALRPSLEEKTFVISVCENRRLTPETYDRNVFHIAFDTKGTGLTYEVGEALGIHGWNDEHEVRDFIDWYGLDADALVSFPSPHDHGKTYETRTVFQLLQQNLDLFGKPSKSFYASLAALATHKNDQRTLRFIAAPEGVALFKKMSEKETVTFADVLKQFKTARPSIEELVGLIPEIKPRHYSIASSQKAVGDRVELLIVTVDWTTPSGSPRFGQCTRYLAGLGLGDKVTVSIKPSVMKLPPLDTQPIIMAGLGTGAAPFRAFIQHRAWQREQGIEVGPLVYYFGSRYRSQEYLYVSLYCKCLESY